MLIAKNDAYHKQLDFADAEMGDVFWVVEHVPYSGTIKGVQKYTVTEIRSKLVICQSESSKPLKIKRSTLQENCYLENDPYFSDIQKTFEISSQVEWVRKLIKEHESRDFDQEVVDAILAWQRRVEMRRE
ncbi:hypothetical protein [Acidithiobacillus concretivorus]|uniref:IDEAL domain-containing protein n=1 Tax=Acidithiobacillus concretivorus TaxID=3063952 RepID=A0ABS5ZRY1_9PROT|nr:hypothetical protein [Acidithiobacillus concretivorus]MBU2738917.1 hypothetical protein [Acidithiobacillus concretivorus]